MTGQKIDLNALLTRSDRERIAEEMRDAANGWRGSEETELADRCDWIAGVFLMAAQEVRDVA